MAEVDNENKVAELKDRAKEALELLDEVSETNSNYLDQRPFWAWVKFINKKA